MTFALTGVALVLITRILGPSQYGLYTLAIAFGGIFSTIGYTGIGTALNKFVSEYRQTKNKKETNAVVSNSLFIMAASGIVIAAICIIFSGTISEYVFHNTSMSYVIDLIAAYIFIVNLCGIFYDTLLGLGSGKDMTTLVVLEALLQAPTSVILALDGFGVSAPILGLIIGYAGASVIGVYLVFRRNGLSLVGPSVRQAKKILSFSVPVAGYNILGTLTSNIALIFVGYFVLPSIIGNIGATSRTGSLVSAVFDSINLALLPAFSAALVNRKLSGNIGRLYSYAVYLAVAFVGPMLFYMAAFSKPFSNLIFSSSYVYAPLYISIMSIGLLLGVAGTYAATLLISANKVKLVFKYNVMVNVIILLLIVASVPAFGGKAYVVATFLVSPLLLDLLLVRRLYSFFKFRLGIGRLLRLALADVIVSAVASCLYLALSGILLLVAAAAAFIILYPIAAAALGGVKKADVSTIKEMSRSIPLAGGALGMVMDYAGLAARR